MSQKLGSFASGSDRLRERERERERGSGLASNKYAVAYR